MPFSLLADVTRAAQQGLDRLAPAGRPAERQALSEPALKAFGSDERQLSGPARARLAAKAAAPVASVVPFDVNAAEATLQGAGRLDAKLNGLGWGRNPREVGLDTHGTYLHYAVAGQAGQGEAAWHDAPLQYLQDGRKGFVLRDVAPGTEIQAAPHVIVDRTHNGWYSVDQQTPDNASAWLTSFGESFKWLTQAAAR